MDVIRLPTKVDKNFSLCDLSRISLASLAISRNLDCCYLLALLLVPIVTGTPETYVFIFFSLTYIKIWILEWIWTLGWLSLGQTALENQRCWNCLLVTCRPQMDWYGSIITLNLEDTIRFALFYIFHDHQQAFGGIRNSLTSVCTGNKQDRKLFATKHWGLAKRFNIATNISSNIHPTFHPTFIQHLSNIHPTFIQHFSQNFIQHSSNKY